MREFPSGTKSVLARCISAEVRARIGADRSLTGKKLAPAIGRSQNYLAERLRDEKPFTLDDIEALLRYFGDIDDPDGIARFVSRAEANHQERVFEELGQATDAADAKQSDFTLAAKRGTKEPDDQ